jgi:DNA-binding NarL/FixJ family response regulator
VTTWSCLVPFRSKTPTACFNGASPTSLSSIRPSTVLALVDSDEVRARVAATGIERMADKTLGLDALVDAIRSSLASGHPVPAGAAGGRTRVLVADDDEGIRMTLADYLGGRGYAVVPARDGLEAVNAVERDSSIRIVLPDVSMPRMGGLEALGSIMARPNHPDVIMMTAVTDREIAR